MTTTQEPQQDQPVSDKQRRQRVTEIGQQVLRSLGEPADFLRVVVRHLWDDCYRVNVFVGTDVAAATIPHSYFVVADRDGHILTAKPTIAKQYCN